MLNDGAINNNLTRGNKPEIINWGNPDYNSGVTRSDNTEYTETTNGWIEVYSSCWDNSTPVTITIDGVSRTVNAAYNNRLNNAYALMPVGKNSVYKVVFARTETGQYINYYPCIGG